MSGQNSFEALEKIRERIRLCDYLVVAQLYLQDNFMLECKLKPEDIKSRLLGHWGTCHGINVAYANLKARFDNNSEQKDGSRSLTDATGSANDKDTKNSSGFTFILGPGHGFPALNANLWLDEELAKVDPQATLDEAGLAYICRQFSWPDGFPSHASPMTPGIITEGGELGYALANAYGLALGHPEKTIAVLIGDGELETATALDSLNLHSLLDGRISNSDADSLDTKEIYRPVNGTVLPILHLNGYKISAPSIYARKSEREMMELIRGFGYTPIIIDGDDTEEFQNALNAEVEAPFIIMKTEKGEGGPNRHQEAHQIPLKNPKTDETELAQLESWLESYRAKELLEKVFDVKTSDKNEERDD